MWRPLVAGLAGLAAGTCQRPNQSAGTNATWPSPWTSEGFPQGASQARPCSGRGTGWLRQQATTHRGLTTRRGSRAPRGLGLPTEVLLGRRRREWLHSLLVCLTSGAGDEEAPSRGKSVDGTERRWQPGSALALAQQYCTVLCCTCACVCVCMSVFVCVCACARVLLAS